jgi:hypothetical protein
VTKRSPISIERGHIHKSMQLKFLSICDLISISTYGARGDCPRL